MPQRSNGTYQFHPRKLCSCMVDNNTTCTDERYLSSPKNDKSSLDHDIHNSCSLCLSYGGFSDPNSVHAGKKAPFLATDRVYQHLKRYTIQRFRRYFASSRIILNFSPTVLHSRWFAYRYATNTHFATHDVGPEVSADRPTASPPRKSEPWLVLSWKLLPTQNVSMGAKWP
jgi:hypothetical protein